MHEVIVCEKPTSAEKIAKALSPSAKKKVYNNQYIKNVLFSKKIINVFLFLNVYFAKI